MLAADNAEEKTKWLEMMKAVLPPERGAVSEGVPPAR
jgi:hypothetical protein